MPGFCHSCPYNKYCGNHYVKNPTCPMGYSPVHHADEGTVNSINKADEHMGHVLEPEILLKIGKTAMNKNEYPGAIETFNKILELDPEHREGRFLLKRAQYMVNGNSTSGSEQEKTTSAKNGDDNNSGGMLPLQEKKSISIKPKQPFKVDPNIISHDTDKVYHVEIDEDEEAMEKVSRNVAQEHKVSFKKKQGVKVAFGLVIIILVMILVFLLYFDLLKF